MSRHTCTDCREAIPFGMAVLRSIRLAGIAAWCRECYELNHSRNYLKVGS